MKTTATLTLTLTILLLSVVCGVRVFDVAEANPRSFISGPFDNLVITVQSPQNKTYNVRTLFLNFTVETNNKEQAKTRYLLNEERPVEVATAVVSSRTEVSWYGSATHNNTFEYIRYTAQGNAVLENLSKGTYSLTVQRYYPDPQKPQGITIINSTTVTFTIDSNAPANPIISSTLASSPTLSVLSPANISYTAVNNTHVSVPLIFATDASISWIGYSLDGGSNVTLSENGAIIDIPIESRCLTLFANDTAGNWASPQTVYYMVAWSGGTPPPEPFPTLPAVAVSAAIVAAVSVAVGIQVYFKKRKQ